MTAPFERQIPTQYQSSVFDWGLSQCQKRFAAYCYASLRLLELQCGWLPIVCASSFKTLLGHRIGYEAERFSLMSKRLGELFAKPTPLAPSIEYVQQFSKAAVLTNEYEIASFLYAIISDMSHSMQVYLQNGDSVADEPGYRILRLCVGQLTQEAKLFEPWIGSDTTICGIDDSLGNLSVPYFGTESIPPLVDIPRRSEGIVFTSKNTHTRLTEEDLVISEDCMLGFLHFVYLDIEIPAMEVCARNINEYREMPYEFKLDMARQIWDEARHAKLVRTRMEELGGSEGDYPIDLQVWKKYLGGSTLAERLAIQQVVQEGNSVEMNIELVNMLHKVGDIKTATLFDYLNADETVHARIGNKWLLYLCNENTYEYESVVRNAAKKIEWTLPGKAPVNPFARDLSGFPKSFVENLLSYLPAVGSD